MRHLALMRAADLAGAFALREEAHRLTQKLNDGKPGILAHDDAVGANRRF